MFSLYSIINCILKYKYIVTVWPITIKQNETQSERLHFENTFPYKNYPKQQRDF